VSVEEESVALANGISRGPDRAQAGSIDGTLWSVEGLETLVLRHPSGQLPRLYRRHHGVAGSLVCSERGEAPVGEASQDARRLVEVE
jgi:hypothetical protein